MNSEVERIRYKELCQVVYKLGENIASQSDNGSVDTILLLEWRDAKLIADNYYAYRIMGV